MHPYYSENGITIYHGDCRDVLPSLPKADLLLTDPPYGMNALNGSRMVRYGIDPNKNWDCSPPKVETISLCLSAARESIIWGANYLCNALLPHKGALV